MQDYQQEKIIQIEVVGKGGHPYQLELNQALPMIKDYLRIRRVNDALEVPLFISHDPRYNGNRMSRVVAWRIVRRAAKVLDLGTVSPQDFRHWQAQKMITAGRSLEDVQKMLGHQSIETVRALYSHLL